MEDLISSAGWKNADLFFLKRDDEFLWRKLNPDYRFIHHLFIVRNFILSDNRVVLSWKQTARYQWKAYQYEEITGVKFNVSRAFGPLTVTAHLDAACGASGKLVALSPGVSLYMVQGVDAWTTVNPVSRLNVSVHDSALVLLVLEGLSAAWRRSGSLSDSLELRLF